VSAPPLAGSLAVVAGASRGIGLAIAEELQSAGAHVVRLARSLADAAADRRTDLRCDVSQAGEVERMAQRVLAQRGAPDVVVNNAGAFMIRPLAETTAAEFEGQLAGNLLAPFLVMRAFLPAMTARGSGLFVTIGSVADHTAFPGNAAYGAGKTGLRGLHQVMAAEIAGSGLRASLISPGPVDTELWDPVDPDTRPGFPKRRDMLRAEDVAEAVLFVCTRARHITIPELHIEPRR
jgi:NAD(P)-dependent dehydrogenase (short-subunit alcohol dehydrogenase family)